MSLEIRPEGSTFPRRLLTAFAAALGIAAATAVLAQDAPADPVEDGPVYDEALVEEGLQVYKDGGCRACHGWAGNGVREGENPEGPSIRQTFLPAEAIRTTIQCGRPSRLMPYYDHQAYNLDDRCYGITRFNAGDTQLPPRGRTDFNDEQLDAIVAYLMTRVVGLPDEPTLEQCVAFFGPDNNYCTLYE